ncbi:MAG: hypothetical protein K0S12_409 [Bacteroidetes bacterium]|nr:hypothetical protein [Bacteroidota bacterium]
MATTSLIPPQFLGAKTGATAKTDSDSRHEAILVFRSAQKKLLDINNWYYYAGETGAKFTHTDAYGNKINNSKPEIGDLIRVELPAPGNKAGDGYDWVRIEAFESASDVLKDEEIFGFRVRPIKNPLDQQNEVAHFYTSTATSTFLLIRSSNKVIAMERARNEKPNTKVFSFFNKIRNYVIALAAMAGLSNPQWKLLMKGLINMRIPVKEVPKNK